MKRKELADGLMKVRAGFPSPANDYLEPQLDYNAYFNSNKASIFSMRVEGDSMKDAGIPHNAIVVVDRSMKPVNNSIVVAEVNGEKIIKQLMRNRDGAYLVPANPKYKPMKIEEGMDVVIWGTVTHAVIDLVKRKK